VKGKFSARSKPPPEYRLIQIGMPDETTKLERVYIVQLRVRAGELREI
jgi:hypothetical protein